MYCSECKLQVADDDVTVCPVCQGPLQPDVKTEEVFNDAADKGGSVAFEDWSPETRIDEKFSVYENPDQNFDFNPEEFGLQSSEHEDPAEKVEDIQVLAELWDDEDVEADLEGVLAEAFILDEAEKDIDVNNRNIDDKNLDIINEDVKEDVKDDVMDQDINVEGEPVNFENVNVGTVEDEQSDEDDEQIIVEDEPVEVINVDVEEIKDIDVEDEYVNVKGESFYVDEQIDEDKDEDDENNDVDDLSFDLGLGEDDLISGQPEVLPVLSPKAAPSRSSRTLLLLFLLLVVIGVGGGAWFYMQNSGTKPKSRVVTSKTQSQPEKAASLTPVKKVVATEKVAAAESMSEVVKSEVVQEKAISGQGGDDSVEVEAVDFKEDKAETLSQKVGDGLAAAVVSQSAGEGQEKIVAKHTAVLAMPAVASVKKTETPAILPVSVGEKKSLLTEKVSPDGSKEVAEIKQLEEVAPAVAGKTEEPVVLPYAIHIGSFRGKNSASRQCAMLHKKGFAAYQVEVDLEKKGVWQRVFVPGGATLEEAKSVQQKLAEFFPKEESLIRKIRR